MASFVVFSAGRSRTAWLARLLSHGKWTCEHEASRFARSLDDVKAALRLPYIGYIDTSAAAFWRNVVKMAPEAKFAVIHRDPEAIVRSFLSLPTHGAFTWDEAKVRLHVAQQVAKLRQIEARVEGVCSLNADDLDDYGKTNELVQHLTGETLDRVRWKKAKKVNVQASVPGLFRQADAGKEKLARLALELRQESIRAMRRAAPVDWSSFEFVNLSLTNFLFAGKDLFIQHSRSVGEPDDSWTRKNLEQWAKIESAGNLLILTAWKNNKMVGYLMTILSPSLERRGSMEAVNTTFFAGKDFPGLGRRLQLIMITALRELNFDKLWLRDGTRGSGGRMGLMYSRLGALPDGQLWSFDLKD